jgi:tRNA(His) guanylyltransferase
MKFDDLDVKMRAFETARDPHALPDALLITRIDGRSFSRLTKDVMNFARPFDETFRDHMIATVHHLMSCGFQVAFGYTQSDEISLLFTPDEMSFARNIRKWTSILAGEASAAFSVRLGRPAAFDCRVIELPTENLVFDYFRWRSEDAHRNALNAWCYWTLRDQGLDVAAATSRTQSLSSIEKIALLSQFQIDFPSLPAWQRHGMGVVWTEFQKPAVNPQTGERTLARRRKLETVLELPERDALNALIGGHLRP